MTRITKTAISAMQKDYVQQVIEAVISQLCATGCHLRIEGSTVATTEPAPVPADSVMAGLLNATDSQHRISIHEPITWVERGAVSINLAASDPSTAIENYTRGFETVIGGVLAEAHALSIELARVRAS